MKTPIVAIAESDGERSDVKVFDTPAKAIGQLDSREVRDGVWRAFDADGRMLAVRTKRRWSPLPPREIPAFDVVPDAPPDDRSVRKALIVYLVSCGAEEAELTEESLPQLIARVQATNARLEALVAAGKTPSMPKPRLTRRELAWLGMSNLLMLTLLAYAAIVVFGNRNSPNFEAFNIVANVVLVVVGAAYLWVSLFAFRIGDRADAPRMRYTVYSLRTTIICAYLLIAVLILHFAIMR